MTDRRKNREEAFVEVSGIRLHYRRAGHGRPLLLVHGLVGSSRNWHRNMAALASLADVIAVDLPNMGRSERVANLDAGLSATADLLAAMLARLGIAEIDLAGHSHGGAVAMMLAARHPQLVRRLVLFAPANPFCRLANPLIRFYGTSAGVWLARRIPAAPRSLKAVALQRMYGDPRRIIQGSLEGYTDDLHVPGTVDHILAILHGWFSEMEALRRALPSLASTPTLLLWGELDRAVGLPSARSLHQALPQSHLVVLPGVGHIPFEELPETINAILKDWLVSANLLQSAVASMPNHGAKPHPFTAPSARRHPASVQQAKTFG